MKYNKSFYFLLFWFIFIFFICKISAQVSDLSLWPPQDLTKLDKKRENLPSQVDIKEIPSVFQKGNYSKSNKRIKVDNDGISANKRLKLIVDSYIDIKKTMAGDYFKAYTQEDFNVIPKGSWIRGHISYIRKSNILFMSSKLKINLDQLITPSGEVTPLTSIVDVQEGIPGENGLLIPQIKEPIQNSLQVDSENNSGIEFLLDGLLKGLTQQFNFGGLAKGQELEIVVGQ